MCGGIISVISVMVYKDYPLLGNALKIDKYLHNENKIKRLPNNYTDQKLTIIDNTNSSYEIESFRTTEYKSNLIINNGKVELSGYRGSFKNLTFTNCMIDSYKLNKSEFIDSNFNKCVINLMMDKQGFDNCNFMKSNITMKNMRFGDEYSYISNCKFDDSEFKDTYFQQETINGRFDNCSFKNTKLNGSDFTKVIFIDCNFRGADLTDSTVGPLIRCKFYGANVKNMTVNGGMSIWTYLYLWCKGANVPKISKLNEYKDEYIG